MYRVFLGLGSNLGDRQSYIVNALEEISKIGHIRTMSSIYETEPVGYKPQPEYLDQVVELETPLDPPTLFKHIKEIEETVGRKHKEHMKPREIDIDILLYEGLSYRDEMIAIPHVKLHYRRFVLEPFNEIAPDVRHSVLNTTISTLLDRCTDRSRVVRVKKTKIRKYRQVS